MIAPRTLALSVSYGRSCLGLAAILLVLTYGRTQVQPGWWVEVGHHNSWVIDANGALLGGLSFSAGGSSVAVDEAGLVYLARTSMVEMLYDRVANTFSSLIISNGLPSGTSTVAVNRSHLWQMGASGEFGYAQKHAYAPTIFVGNVATMTGVTGGVLGLVTNGRELFFSSAIIPANSSHIWALDTSALPLRVRGVATLPGPTRPAPTLTMGPDNDLLVLDLQTIWRVDTVSGTVSFHSSAPPDPYFGSRGTLAYDAWTDTMLAAPYDGFTTLYRKPPGGSWSLFFFDFMMNHRVSASADPQPFELFGIGCTNGTGNDPRLDWQGLPLRGQSFAVHIYQAEPGGVAFFWLGMSETSWLGLPLPWEAGPVGAPGCRLYVAPESPSTAVVDGSGRASLTIAVPMSPSLAGMTVLAQSASSSIANALGLASSDALVIRVR